jgi:hypothetical protein
MRKISNCIPTVHASGLRLDVWPGRKAWFAAPADTILAKLIAGRAKDFEDAMGMASVCGSRLDWEYVNSWAKRLELTAALARVRAKRA